MSYLVGEGLLDIDKSAFTDPILADTEIDMELVQAYCAPVGAAPMPTVLAEIDTNKWTPMHLDPELMAVVQGKANAAGDETPTAS
jgi:hypothetical protein